jgi:hypothetical protein
VTWFRHSGSYDYDHGHTQWGADEVGCGDGKCPLCGNKGINNVSYSTTKSNYYTSYLNKVDINRFQINKKYIKKKDASKELQLLYSKLLDKQAKLNNIVSKEKEYKTLLKTKEVNYEETKKIMSTMRKSKWAANRGYNAIRKTISRLPIIPLIIPTPIDIN